MSKAANPMNGLPVIHERAASIDIGSRFHVVAVPTALTDEPVQTFQAFTADIRRMAAWLKSIGVETVVMELTGVYWAPVFEVLESAGLDVMVANARETRSVRDVRVTSTMRNGCSDFMPAGCCERVFVLDAILRR